MNYKKLYDKIIENRQQNPINEGYSEKHHIKPKSLGGEDNLDNLVRLSAREHFICHYLLAKMYKKESFEWYKMNHAFLQMKASSITQDRYFNSRLYEALRGDFSSVMSFAQKGKKNSQHGTCWVFSIEKEESLKIKKSNLSTYEYSGWLQGRYDRRNWKVCEECGITWYRRNRSKFCSDNCKTSRKLKSMKTDKYKKFTTKGRKHSEESKKLISERMIEVRKNNNWSTTPH